MMYCKNSSNPWQIAAKKVTIGPRPINPIFVKLRVRVRVKVKVKSLKSKLDPEVGVVMGWPTTPHHPPPTRQLFLSLKLLVKAR